jgi:hypothetical protein
MTTPPEWASSSGKGIKLPGIRLTGCLRMPLIPSLPPASRKRGRDPRSGKLRGESGSALALYPRRLWKNAAIGSKDALVERFSLST